ncbi:hypothetical protein BS47DRAFT_1349549 [Hydnum rufescens UP504]|uniref:Protein rds1 n=1 Tax=Hydnum rufescens UP504 TaxID=1448309 RepID=A0A9P6DPM8_9AGAM|nr:hypothetical protein BS47DRAFT_1349549 [Hydnum rufescens UP504]
MYAVVGLFEFESSSSGISYVYDILGRSPPLSRFSPHFHPPPYSLHMKFTAILLLSTAYVVATPLKREGPTDIQILQYALTLEHLENSFYYGALDKFDEDTFTKAGLPAWARGRFQQIADHEATHVSALTSAIGAGATAPCNYSFPYTDPMSFAALSSVLEGVGVSAYLGAAQFISNKAYLTSRHQAWVASAIDKTQPWSLAFDTPLGLSQVYSLAASFITGCPKTNPSLPVKAFPQLTSAPPGVVPGKRITYAWPNPSANTTYYAVYYSGLTIKTVQLSPDYSATLPDGLIGTFYTIVTTAGDGNVTDANTVAGPEITVINFGSNAT